MHALTVKSSTSLIDFLFQHYGQNNWSKKKLKWALEHNLVRVNHLIIREAKAQLKSGDKVFFFIHDFPNSTSFTLDLSVLYEDANLAIINKAPFFCSDDPKLIASACKLVGSPLFLVHRLDKGTSGALLFAKSKAIKEKLIQLFRERKVKKSYLALCEGSPKKNRGTISNTIGPVKSLPGQSLQGLLPPPKGKEAISYWKVLLKTPTCCLVEVSIPTGRMHQIRLHLSLLGMPIIGDALYGKKFFTPYISHRPLLHANRLSVEGGKVKAKAPLCQDFEKILDKLCKHPKAIRLEY